MLLEPHEIMSKSEAIQRAREMQAEVVHKCLAWPFVQTYKILKKLFAQKR